MALVRVGVHPLFTFVNGQESDCPMESEREIFMSKKKITDGQFFHPKPFSSQQPACHPHHTGAAHPRNSHKYICHLYKFLHLPAPTEVFHFSNPQFLVSYPNSHNNMSYHPALPTFSHHRFSHYGEPC